MVIVRCPLCGSWIEGGALDLHRDLVHTGDNPAGWGFIQATDAMITSGGRRAGIGES